MSNEREIRSSDIAVIGMNCRVPGAKNPEEFWENLKAGKESIVFFDDQELRAAGVPQETLDDPHYVKARATLDNIDLFDAASKIEQTLKRSFCCLQTFKGKIQLFAIRNRDQQIPYRHWLDALGNQIAKSIVVTQRLAHLLAFDH